MQLNYFCSLIEFPYIIFHIHLAILIYDDPMQHEGHDQGFVLMSIIVIINWFIVLINLGAQAIQVHEIVNIKFMYFKVIT